MEEEFRLFCGKRIESDRYNSVVKCPAFVKKTNHGFSPEISLTWTSLSLGVLFPDLSSSDGRIEIQLEKGSLYVKNLTEGYLEVSSIALYGGSEVQENRIKLSLAPLTSNKKAIPIFQLSNSELRGQFTFNEITRQDVTGKSISFGLAVKYEVGLSGNFETFHILNDVKLDSLIQEQLPHEFATSL